MIFNPHDIPKSIIYKCDYCGSLTQSHNGDLICPEGNICYKCGKGTYHRLKSKQKYNIFREHFDLI